MEIDSGHRLPGEPIEVNGELFHFNKGAAFFRFNHENKEEICLFRPNKLYLNKQKLGASNFKSIETISRIVTVGDRLGALVVAHQECKSYRLEDLNIETTPGWYAVAVWKGDKPEEVSSTCLGEEGKIKTEQEIVIDDVAGKIVHNKIAINGKGGANQTFIAFTTPDGKPDLAMFRNPRYFYIDGERCKPEQIKSWTVSTEVEVMFSGIHTPSLKEYIHVDGESGEGMNVETKYKPNWRARLVWVGRKPSEETVSRDNADRMTTAKNKKDKTEFLETIKDCEYLCARLEKLVSPKQVKCAPHCSYSELTLYFTGHSHA